MSLGTLQIICSFWTLVHYIMRANSFTTAVGQLRDREQVELVNPC